MIECDNPGLVEGLRIHRDVPPLEWREAVDALPDQLRPEAERYLRNIVRLNANKIAFAKECGCTSLEEFEELRKRARAAGAPGARAWHKAGRPQTWRRGG